MGNLLSELKRRNIFCVASIYAVVGWLLAQVAIEHIAIDGPFISKSNLALTAIKMSRSVMP